MIELTIFTKTDGPLTKQISLGEDGTVKSDGSACVMSYGVARRFRFARIEQFADLIIGLQPNEALAVGALRPDLPDEVRVVTKRKLNGDGQHGVIARTQDYISYGTGVPALAPIDFDIKGMPPAVAKRIEEAGGFWQALVSVLPALEHTERVARASTSAGLYDARTGERFPGSGGIHVYLRIKDGSDNERFLKTLHERCWLKGFGWMIVGKAGQLLEHSIVDRACGTAERLLFEGNAILVFPVAQDHEARRPIVDAGTALDTVAACLPLIPTERARVNEMRAAEGARLASAASKARQQFIGGRIEELIKRTGIDRDHATRVIARQCDGILLPRTTLHWDDDELAGSTVADILANPDRFDGETLADPNEGPEYGRCKARVMRDADGWPWINSFAHGGIRYELKFDFQAALTAITEGKEEELPDLFVRVVLRGDLDPVEIHQLLCLTAKRSKVSRTALKQKLKDAQRLQPPPRRTPRDRFTIINDCLTYLKEIAPGVRVPVPLANFVARIIEDQIFDDGAVAARRYRICGALDDGSTLPTTTVPAVNFCGASWVGPRWGARAIVHVGIGAVAICEAIQTLSGEVPEKRIFGHLGWRLVDHEWVYLHAGGGIGSNGPVPSVIVEMEGSLSSFALPPPPTGETLKAAVRKSLGLLKLNTITAGATWRAPLAEFCPVNFSIFTEGRTGSLKSALHAVAQSHWGAHWAAGVHFPANWSATANYLEKIAFLAKDCLLIIDDFVPKGSRYSVHELNQKAEQVLRGQGNLGGRGRLDRSTVTRPTYYPRGLIGSSGEDIPHGQSLRARMIIDAIEPDAIKPDELATLQVASTAGLLAQAMAGYVRWLAEQADADGRQFRNELASRQSRLSEEFSAAHRRTAHAAASLMLGIHQFIEFATCVGAVGDQEPDQLIANAKQSLLTSVEVQKEEQSLEDPADVYMNAVPSLLAAGRAHLTTKGGNHPNNPSCFGWRKVPRRNQLEVLKDDWLPQGDRIGWLADNQVWLLPDESVAAVERLLREQGRSLAVSRNALGKRLREKNLLAETDQKSFTKTKRIGVGAVRVFVLAEVAMFKTCSEDIS